MATSYQDDYVKTALRLPGSLHARLMEVARNGGRSLNAELIARLEASFSDSDAAAKQPSAELSTFLARMRADQKIQTAQTNLQLALMRAENASTATRGLTLEIRQLREEIAEAERVGLPAQDIDSLRGVLRMAEHVLPQQLEMIRAATEEAKALQDQLSANEQIPEEKK